MNQTIGLGQWGETLILRENGRHGLRDCSGDIVELEPEQWAEVARRLSQWMEDQPADSSRPSTSP